MNVSTKSASPDSRIARIARLDLREVWPHEANDFTPWLEENIDVLSEAIGIELGAPEREKAAGAFSVDLVTEDGTGGRVVIENQLERSNHDHLGKVLTYLVAIEARRAIWVVADPRPEHVGAINWLNESSSGDFHLVKLEAVTIGDSPVAPLLTQIVGPTEETRTVKIKKGDLTDRDRLRYRFFEALLEHARTKTDLHANISPSRYHWVSAASGVVGFGFNYVVVQHGARVELYINTKDAGENRRRFDALHAEREQIESTFGGRLAWEPLEGKQACRVRMDYDSGGWKDEDRWPAVHEELAEGMRRLERAMRPHLENLR